MQHMCMYILIVTALSVSCRCSLPSDSIHEAESILQVADSMERTLYPYTDTIALQKALDVFISQERIASISKMYYHLGNAYKSYGADSLAYASYSQAADLFLMLSDSIYYPLSVLEMSLISERYNQTGGNATMLDAIRAVQREMINDRAKSTRLESLWWLLVIFGLVSSVVTLYIVRRRKAAIILSVSRSDLDRNIELVLSHGNIRATLHWQDYAEFSKTANAYLYNIVETLQAEEQLTEQDIRFLVLVLLDLSAKEIAEIMNLSQNSISNKKTRTAQKLGTIAAELRETIISIILKTTKQ